MPNKPEEQYYKVTFDDPELHSSILPYYVFEGKPSEADIFNTALLTNNSTRPIFDTYKDKPSIWNTIVDRAAYDGLASGLLSGGVGFAAGGPASGIASFGLGGTAGTLLGGLLGLTDYLDRRRAHKLSLKELKRLDKEMSFLEKDELPPYLLEQIDKETYDKYGEE